MDRFSSELFLGRSRAEPQSAQSLRVWAMDGTTCPSRSIVPTAAVQQIVFDAGHSIVERMIRDQV